MTCDFQPARFFPGAAEESDVTSVSTVIGSPPGVFVTTRRHVTSAKYLDHGPVSCALAPVPATSYAPGDLAETENERNYSMIPITVVDVRDASRSSPRCSGPGVIAQGPMVKRFEDAFAEIAGVEHAVAVNSGTTALVASLQVLDLQPGDEVVTSPFTFVATLNAILEAGATARFADIREPTTSASTRTRSPPQIGPRTKVLMPVHLYGQMADMTKLAPLADAARPRAWSRTPRRRSARRSTAAPAGSYGLGCFSLYATKNITTAEGGVITTSDATLADRLRVLRNQGMRARYQYEVAGHNYRMTDLHAAVGIPQLEKLDAAHRAAASANAERAVQGLADVPGLRRAGGAAGPHARLAPVHGAGRRGGRADPRRAGRRS